MYYRVIINLIIYNLDVSLTSNSSVSGALASLTITFTPGQPILTGGLIRLTLPYFNKNAGDTSNTNISLIPQSSAVTLINISVNNII